MQSKKLVISEIRADNLRMPTEIQFLRITCTTTYNRDSLWQVSNNSDGNCRSCTHAKLLKDGQADRRLGL